MDDVLERERTRTATIDEAEHLLQTVYNLCGHTTGREHVASDSYHLPAHISPHTDFPGGGSGPKTAGRIYDTVLSDLSMCDQYITLDCLRALYGLNYTPGAVEQNSYGIVEYTPEAYLQSYSQTEYQSFDYNGESDLDLQYGMGASFNNPLDALDGPYCTFEGGDDPTQDSVYPGPNGYDGPEACGTATPTNVISTSYFYDEADITPLYAARQCAEYVKLGLMGVAVLYSPGNYGVASNGGLCWIATQTQGGTIFNPSFPGTCPYITSVGATMVAPNSTVYEPEVASEEVISSGGGFSNYFAMPEYQKKASRAYPDISANGANHVVAVDGQFELACGTSCSSLVSGGIFTMINDARLSAGKSTIGFINPTIYSASFAGLFNDITMGDNPGCGTNGSNATVGWDAVTGLGTPNFPKLLAAWLELS
ncbi:hypothetical protein PAXRUDRAFT_29503 [Paxillus rubicundulus Ve08.2h10]|uniref:Unplaced genomic scaffold scaffold_3, whole genome shotgun sequence n=1 Tax=Paxillus rubicundulus Ve08.2h10 TaxID=930991 RepID=A0A0D0EDC5_9AGAM|nr:hypothetical protein PAXRUDRAFT_29503 [Paxillus rubicundulus Ve08.2h10]